MSRARTVMPPWLPAEPASRPVYSYGVLCEASLHVSGMVSFDATGRTSE